MAEEPEPTRLAHVEPAEPADAPTQPDLPERLQLAVDGARGVEASVDALRVAPRLIAEEAHPKAAERPERLAAVEVGPASKAEPDEVVLAEAAEVVRAEVVGIDAEPGAPRRVASDLVEAGVNSEAGLAGYGARRGRGRAVAERGGSVPPIRPSAEADVPVAPAEERAGTAERQVGAQFVGVRQSGADGRSCAELLLRPRDAEEPGWGEGVARERGEAAAGEAARRSPCQLGRADDRVRRADPPGVEEPAVAPAVDRVIEDRGAFEEERAALGEERLERREVELRRVRVDLPEVGVDGGVEDEV